MAAKQSADRIREILDAKYETANFEKVCTAQKMSKLFDGLDFIRTYIDDLLCLIKGSFKDHLEKLKRPDGRSTLTSHFSPKANSSI